MKAVVVLLLALTSCVLAADANTNNSPQGESQPDCQLDGVWHNELGSKMTINSIAKDGAFDGEYHTAVETHHGAAGHKPSKLMGYTSTNGDYPTFGMTVIWRSGQSVTSWTGQCYLCDGEETLLTTWILTSYEDNCDKSWEANRVGQDMFKRHKIADGPRRKEDTHNQRDYARRQEQEKHTDL